MFKRLTIAATLGALAFGPHTLAAQESAAAAEQVAPRSYAPINYKLDEDRDNILVLDLSNGMRVQIRLMQDWAPAHVERIKTLTRRGFYDGITFHRVIEGFMAQAGDPTGTGTSGSDLPDLKAEFNPMPHLRGSLAMARRADSEDSANSQFFIVFQPRFTLDKNYTNFGRVIAGMDAVDAIARGEPPASPTVILQASIAADNKPVPALRGPAAVEEEITADMLNAPVG